MTNMLRQIDRDIAEGLGYHGGSAAEDAAVRWLHRHGPAGLMQQHRVGRYRLDFAWPEKLLGVEIDGPVHRNPDAAFRDSERDRWLKERGWIIFRVAAYTGSFERELLRTALAISVLVEGRYEAL